MCNTTRIAVTLAAMLLLVAISRASAQIAAPNAMGVAMGHLHYVVTDVAANKAFWLTLGGREGRFAPGARVDFPNLVVLLSQGKASGGTDGAVVNHVAFRVASLEAIAQTGLELEYNAEYPGIASVFTPEGERIELFDDQLATNIGFDANPGLASSSTARHNRPLDAPIVSHHVHLYVPEGQVSDAQRWYVEQFGAVPGKRWRYDAADLPGINLNFSPVATVQAPTRGRMLDHIGFEVDGLAAFCAALEARGIALDRPYEQLPSGVGLAFLTDPWGTTIELTEGLR